RHGLTVQHHQGYAGPDDAGHDDHDGADPGDDLRRQSSQYDAVRGPVMGAVLYAVSDDEPRRRGSACGEPRSRGLIRRAAAGDLWHDVGRREAVSGWDTTVWKTSQFARGAEDSPDA